MKSISIQELYDIYIKHPKVETDSRKELQGAIFFALKGDNFNGNEFAQKALDSGAQYAVVDEQQYAKDSRCILVDNALETLQQLAKYHRQQLKIPFIAITGSNGKTTTKELVYKTLSAKYKTTATEGNLNNHIGVPLTILKIATDDEMAIIEMGANHQREIAFYCSIAMPNYGLITNCGKAHLEGFGGIEGIRKGKGELYDFIKESKGGIFRYTDYDYLQDMSGGIENQITYGTSNAQVIGKALHNDFFLSVAIMTSGLETNINTKLVGDYNLPNVLAAVAIGNHFNVNIDIIKIAVEHYTPTNNRSQLIEKRSNQIISDAYNANPASMKLALENLSTLSSNQKWVMLGGMKEMGDASDAEHQALVDLAVSLQLKNIILVGNEFKNTRHTFIWFENSEEAATYIKSNPINDSVILVKGSRGSKMEKIVEVL